MMKTSAEGLAWITRREGIRLGAYRDSRGLWTIGVGHLTNEYFPVHPGQIIGKATALDLLAHDLAEVEATINRCVKVPLQQYEFDALASLGYNIGVGGLRGSAVVHFVNTGHPVQAADAFRHWEHPAELKARRESERRQFLGLKP